MDQPLIFQENVALAELTTMKLGSSRARYFYELTDATDLPKIHLFAVEQQLPIRILGGGSNSLATDNDFPGIVIKNCLTGIKKKTLNGDNLYNVASGEVWDDFVAQTVQDGMSGLEALSGIPGTVGATPVQNVGAYGQEIADVMSEFEAYDFIDNHFVTVKTNELDFAYRTSALKTHNVNRYFITSVTFKLRTGEIKRPLYWSLEKYLETHDLSDVSPAKIRAYVLAIRAERIPNHYEHPSAGSFFENAEITPAKFTEIKQNYPDIPYGTEQKNGLIKIPTAWLMEKAGLVGQTIHGIEIGTASPMILVNRSATSFSDLMNAKRAIVKAIAQKFDIAIEQEPIVIR